MLLTIIISLGLIGYVVWLVQFLKIRKYKNESNFYMNLLPEFPTSCRLYYEKGLSRNCKRCSASGKRSELIVRKRYQLFKDQDGSLKVKNLTHVYHCPACGYRGLCLE